LLSISAVSGQGVLRQQEEDPPQPKERMGVEESHCYSLNLPSGLTLNRSFA